MESIARAHDDNSTQFRPLQIPIDSVAVNFLDKRPAKRRLMIDRANRQLQISVLCMAPIIGNFDNEINAFLTGVLSGFLVSAPIGVLPDKYEIETPRL